MKLISGVNLPVGDLNKVLEVRNAAIHMGLVDGPELQASAASMVQVVDKLLEIANISRRDYWGDQPPQNEKIAGREALQKALKAEIDKAKAVADSFEPLDRNQIVEDLLRNSDDEFGFDLEEYPEGASYWYAQKCPVCERAGTVFCSRSVTAPQENLQGESVVEEHAKSISYRCNSCHLELDERGMVELRLGGDRSIGYRSATEDEVLAYQEYLAERHYEYQHDLKRGK
ncbi:hypothetical protein [Rhodococcus sp. 27YEA15]|uniref:hypothetical protein n=1 Tax=Rhodococcus sp. 27YEA15 TaxID=3156259 RepID=UPI003C7C81AE